MPSPEGITWHPRAARPAGRPAARRRAGWSTRFSRPPEAQCRRACWSTRRAHPTEAKCRRAFLLTVLARPPECKCPRAGWSTGRARPPESKCPRAGWSTALARPPDSKCPRGGWSTRPSREERKSTRATPDTQLRASWGHQEARSGDRRWVASRRPAHPLPRSNYELCNCSNFNIRSWSWNYRVSWHQTCPPKDPHGRI